MNRTIRGLAIGASLLFCTNAVSSGCCTEGLWEVGAEALWWKPCLCPFEYGNLTPDDNARPRNFDVLKVKPNADWGFRVWVAADRDCYFTSLDWTYLKVANTDSVGPVEAPAELITYFSGGDNPQQKAVARMHTRYNKVRWKVAYYLHRSCDLSFHTFAGIRYVKIEHENRLNATPSDPAEPSQSFVERAKWQGPAVEIGFGGGYHIGCGLYLKGHIAAIGGVGQQRLSPMTLFEGASERHDFDTYTSCIPALEFKVGISYTYVCGCFELTGEVGYEIDHYYGALAFFNAHNNFGASGSYNLKSVDIGFAGPYIGLGVTF